MNKSEILRARWITLGVLMLVFGLYLYTSTIWNPWIMGLTAAILAVLLTFMLERWLQLFSNKSLPEQSKKMDEFHEVEKDPLVQNTFDHLRKLITVHSEKEILESIMQAGIEILGADGTSFVPFDEWGQSLPALVLGKIPEQALMPLSQNLSRPETRQVCKNCKSLQGDESCTLLTYSRALGLKVHCFRLLSTDRQMGVFNFFLNNKPHFGELESKYLKILIEAAGQALENLHSHDQEIEALHYLQRNKTSKSDLSILLNDLLENVRNALDVDFATLYLPSGIPEQYNTNTRYITFTKGKPDLPLHDPDITFLEGIWKSVLSSGHSLSLENVILNKQEKWKTLLAVPLAWLEEVPDGVLILGSNSNHVFTPRHQALLETLAGQAALLIQNARLMVLIEFQAVVDERTRLAREIHDGLAQTLAFLKIQAAQMQNFLAQGETEKLTNTLQANYRTLSDAYIDARQAIDNLRRSPSTNLRDWIGQVAGDFEQSTHQKIDIAVEEFPHEYPVNIQAQLIRIVQEALSNIRKHAQATCISIRGYQDQDSYLIEIRDDGIGFDPDMGTIDGTSHYGLQGMRERSENIGADFQITSKPGMGTCVSLRLPSMIKEES